MIQFPEFERSPIDIHSHFNHGVPGEYGTVEYLNTSQCQIPFLLAENKRFGIKEIAFSSYSAVLCSDYICEENQYLNDLVHNTEGIYQWAVLHPEQPKTFEQVDAMLGDKKVLGIKIHPYFHKYKMVERADRIFSFANERDAVVMMHPAATECMMEFADKYPRMKLIIAHLAGETEIKAIKYAKHQNIYADTSGSLSALNNVIEYACEQIGSEKILFGTDTYSLTFQYSRVALAKISHAEKENIFYKNAIKLFPWAFEK
ncbi:MAG: amidohydrolase [Clostridia bacterium]|nr:amidohydrolase [Clostridia bacterium]